MAIIVTSDGRKISIDSDKAVNVWLVLTDRLKPTDEQAKFCSNIKKVYLNWRSESTPDEYIKDHEEVIKEISKGHWMCDRDGNPTRPEYNDTRSWYLKNKFGW